MSLIVQFIENLGLKKTMTIPGQQDAVFTTDKENGGYTFGNFEDPKRYKAVVENF